MEIGTTKMSSRGQVVIPLEIRREIGLKTGERFLIYDTDDSIVLKRIRNVEKIEGMKEFKNAFASMWKTAKARAIKYEDIEKEIELSRKEKNA